MLLPEVVIEPTGASNKVSVEDTSTFVNAVPKDFLVHQPYPNPFNPSTTIRYELPKESYVEFVVYDILRRKVRVLDDIFRSAGIYDILWNRKCDQGKKVASGVYLFQVKAGEFVKHGKMVLVR